MRILIFASEFLDEGADTDPEFKSLRPDSNLRRLVMYSEADGRETGFYQSQSQR